MIQTTRDIVPPDFRLRARARVRVMQRLRSLTFREFLDNVRIADPHQGIIPWQDWSHLIALADEWEAGQSQIVLKARQIGVSWLLAAYMVWRIMYHPGAVCLALSRREDEAAKLVGHREAGKARLVYRHLPDNLKLPLIVDNALELAWDGGGRITAFSSTEDSGRSESATLIVVDEAAFHPYASANYAGYHPAIDAGGQLLMVSTAHHVSGQYFRDLYWASKDGQTPYQARFRSWRSRPGRDDAWLEAERSAFVGLPAEFDEEYPETDAAAFVALSGLVFPQFSRSRHLRWNPCQWQDYRRRYGAVDLGGGDPQAVLSAGLHYDGSLQFHALSYWPGGSGMTVDDAVNALWQMHKQAPYSSVWIDPPIKSIVDHFRAMGLPAYGRIGKKGDGLAEVATMLETGKMFYDPSMEQVVREYESYRWRERVDPNSKDRYKTSTPIDHHGETMDCTRMIVLRVINDETMQQEIQIVPMVFA